MNAPSRRHRRVIAVGALSALVGLMPSAARAQTAAAPDSFSIDVAATGALIEVSAPAALPLDVLAGLSYAQVGINSQPRIQSTAAPLFVPLAQDTGLLGGTSGVLGIVIRLAPGLVVGLPTLVGLDPLPADPSAVPVGPVADFVSGLPLPGAPPLGCTSNLPDEPRAAECGGGAQDFFGFRVGAGSARTSASGDPEDTSTLQSRSDASVVGVGPGGSSGLVPITVGTLASTSEGRIQEGRAVAAASAAAGDVDIAGQFSLGSVEARFSGALGGTTDTLDQQLECNIVGTEFGGEELKLGTEAITFGDDDSPLPLGGLIAGVDDVIGTLGGEVGPADFGSITVTPNPAPVSEVSPDGTSVNHRFGCLEIRYRIPRSGTDVRITLGNIAVSVNAANDEPFGSDALPDGPLGNSTTDGSGSTLSPTGASIDGTGDSGDGDNGGFALPSAPDPGGQAPKPSETPFLTSTRAAGWGIDGGWLGPFTLLALSIPALVKSRRFTAKPTRR